MTSTLTREEMIARLMGRGSAESVNATLGLNLTLGDLRRMKTDVLAELLDLVDAVRNAKYRAAFLVR